MKRIFDILMSAIGLILLSPLMLGISICVFLSSRGPLFFCQERVGQHLVPFTIYKFRTMVADAPALGPSVTGSVDPRVTAIGRILRKSKLDELPQLLNVLQGQMSLVGPRPEVQRFVQLFPEEFRVITMVKPGLTDLASLVYRNEASLLGKACDLEAEYVSRILPHKLRLARLYIRHSSIGFDIRLIILTLVALLRD